MPDSCAPARSRTAWSRCLLALWLCSAAGCQAQGIQAATPEPQPVNGVGYVIFNTAINPVSRDLLEADIDKLRAAGATEIHLGMNSPGGAIEAAQTIVDYMARLHAQNGVTFKAYNIGLVASAATYVFLTAQSRYSAPRSAFLFHAASLNQAGPITAPNLRDAADKLDAYERVVRATLKTRTRLTDDEALTYVRRTVVLSSDDALRDGVVDGIEGFTIPPGGRAWMIATRPPAAGTPARPTGTATPPPG